MSSPARSAPSGTPTAPARVRPYSAQNWPIGAAMLQMARPVSPNGGLPQGWRDDIEEVHAAGFDHIDLTDSWVQPGDLEQVDLDALSGAMSSLSLGFSAISITRRSVVDPDSQVAQTNFDYAMRTVEAAASLGIPVVCLGLHQPLLPSQEEAHWFWLVPGASDPDDPAVRAQAIHRFRAIGEHAASLGVEISLELYEDTYLGSAERCVQFVKEIGLPNVGLNPDIGNIIRLHRPVEHWEQMLRTMLPHTNYWHVKNYFRDFDPATGAYFTAPIPLELGYINYRRAIEMALEAGFAGPFCVEHYGGDGLSVTATNREYLRRILEVKLRRSR